MGILGSDIGRAVNAVERMNLARMQLGRVKGRGYLTTSEAVEQSLIPMSAETLLEYPDYVMPRCVQNPTAKRRTYFWDPRDVLALPDVLKRWAVAIEKGSEAVETFRQEREKELENRALEDLILTREAA